MRRVAKRASARIGVVVLSLSLVPLPLLAGPPDTSASDETRDEALAERGLARLSLEGSAIGVEVIIHDEQGRERSLGEVPLELEVPAGRFELSVDEPGYLPWRRAIELAPGERLRVAVEPELIDVGMIVATPTSDGAVGAELFVDGERACKLPCRATAAPGQHRVEIRKRKYKPVSFELELAQADQVELDVTLERATSRAPAIITGSVALVTLGTAIAFTARADATRRELAADLAAHHQYDAQDARIDVGRRDALIGSGLFGVTAIVGALTFYYLLRQPGMPSRVEKRRQTLAGTPSFGPYFSPHGGGLVGEVRF